MVMGEPPLDMTEVKKPYFFKLSGEMIMNIYEIAELENQDLYCEYCESLISTKEYIDNDGLCNKCYNE